jgi:multidrug efflux system outer membrane protein
MNNTAMNMNTKQISMCAGIALLSFVYTACVKPNVLPRAENKNTPDSYAVAQDSTNSTKVNWKEFFTDPNLAVLIDSALSNNQELNIVLQEINIARNEVRIRKGEYLPFINLQAGSGAEKPSRSTTQGAIEDNLQIEPGKDFPEPLPDYMVAAKLSWEVDIWKKLRNAKKSAMMRYLATTEGKNFMVTHLIAEIANSYYELMALDNQLAILKQTIDIQTNALEIVRLQKQTAKVTELAVRRFEAEVLKNRSRQYFIAQQIVETENHINFLVGRFPQPVQRNSQTFNELMPTIIRAGVPSQLLNNRPDIRRAELELAATKLDVKSAKANFYPSLNIDAAFGLQSFNPAKLATFPESMFYSLGAGLFQPLVNRNAIKAYYFTANSKQIQAVYDYEQTILTAYIEVANQLSNINNLQQGFTLQSQQVQALTQSTDISIQLFKSARADYMEVLLTQRDALDSKFELIETKKQQMNAVVNMYQALGGGWK